ncbi:hypothetical protein [Streptomyces sp. CB02959]|uniref:hypothetical protein n=1 Tax=Streptomyces sp. CB02959 TaxID=2020330 RepID=UPI0021537BD2|nr:hypothetical protein [Streptomyces sp. CB02959]
MAEDPIAQNEVAAHTRRVEQGQETAAREFGIVKSDLTAVRLYRRVVAMSDPDIPDFSALAGEGGQEQLALDAIRAVVGWYTTQIVAEHRAAVPDQERMEELKAARQAALADQAQLATADEEEAARVAAAYAARLKKLTKP